MPEFTYRTFNMNPSDYERDLADALFAIMAKSVHDPAGIVAGLNQSGPKPKDGGIWTIELFEAEMQHLGTWTNSVGAPVGTHGAPGVSRRKNVR